ncbi:MAG: cysteine--tRNA ligase [Candidatus Anstonellales archaeon]
MRIYNTFTRSKEEFKPIKEGQVSMYVCGITTYDYTHLGHARTFVSFDVIRRYLIYKGYKVSYVQNVTDIDDKIINRAKETGEDPLALSNRFDILSREDLNSLGILKADAYPRVSENINEIISLVQRLIEKGFAYKTQTGVYFSVEKFKAYGKLSHQKLSKIKAGARVEVGETKKNPADFALWKITSEDELGFPSPFGRGRPGWHIECSAMSLKYHGETFDIHGGAQDLIFPHHENEIAQSECANGKKFVQYWMHVGFLTVNGEKMSKSLGNFITVRDALKKFTPHAIRMFFIQTHYRSPIDFSEKSVISAQNALTSIYNTLKSARETALSASNVPDNELELKISKTYKLFEDRMDDDFDTPSALAALFRLVSLTNTHISSDNPSAPSLSLAANKIESILKLFALMPPQKSLPLAPIQKILISYGIKQPPNTAEACINQLIEMRNSARKKKNFELSDKIRAELAKVGVILEDSGDKTTYKIC